MHLHDMSYISQMQEIISKTWYYEIKHLLLVEISATFLFKLKRGGQYTESLKSSLSLYSKWVM